MVKFIPSNLNIDFLKVGRPFVLASTLGVIISIILLIKPGLHYGIDFTGGAEIQLKLPLQWNTAKLRDSLIQGGIKDPVIVQLGEPQQSEYLVKVQASSDQLKVLSEEVNQILKKEIAVKDFEIQKVDVVGPEAGSSLKTSAFLSILFSAIGIMIYIWFRFDVRFAPGMLRALLFDVVTTLGIWVILGKEFNLTILAALLTIAGYSCNDTIVIYDRIRDYAKSHPKWPLEQVVNRSINQNLGRTILTVLCTLFVVVSLWLLGGPVLADFAFCMLIGFAISIFSTIFVANTMVVYMEKRRLLRLQSKTA